MKRKPRNNDNGFEQWGGYMEAKIGKLEEQYSATAAGNHFKESDLFNGISIFVNGRTNPTADELKRIMLTHGGVFHHYQRSHTTFVIASNLPDVKVRMMNCSKVIRPEWIVNCLQQKRIIDFSSYLLVTNQRTTQPKLMFTKKADAEIPPDDANAVKMDELSLGLAAISEKIAQKHVDDEDLFEEEPDPVALPEAEKTKNQARTAVDPNFLTEFYNNSRLHHIATMGAKFKHLVSDWREKHGFTFPDRDGLKSILPKTSVHIVAGSKTVMHIDMDCFFVSVGLRNHPNLRGHPVAVTHSKGSDSAATISTEKREIRKQELQLHLKRLGERYQDGVGEDGQRLRSFFEGTDSLSEIASCSYEARAMGVKNGMFVGAALKLCPDLKTIPYDFEGYQEVATKLYSIIAKYTLDIEAVSCDEMYVELSSILEDVQADAMEFVKFIRNEIRDATKCPCSAGVGGNRLQARMATKKAKPDGQFYLQPEAVEEYFQEIPISDLPGVGSSTSYKLASLKLKSCGDLQLVSLLRLQSEFGKKFGETLYQSCRGIDVRPLVYGHLRKSVSAEVNYGIRFTENSELETFLQQLCAEVRNRLIEINRKGKCVTLKFMVRAKDAPTETSKFMGHGVCDHVTKSISLASFTSELDLIYSTVIGIKNTLNISPKELRGIGIQITKLDNPSSKEEKSNVLLNMFSKVAEKNQECKNSGPKAVLELPKIEKSLPAKVASKKKKLAKGNLINSIMAMQLKGHKDQISEQLNEEDPEERLDEAVLAELPEDIRQEVIRDYKYLIQQKKRENDKNNSEAAGSRKSLPNDSCVEVTENAPDSIKLRLIPRISTENIWIQNDWRNLVRSWIMSNENPQRVDIVMIGQHSRELIKCKEMAELHLRLRFLFRIIKENRNSCVWHQIFLDIVNDVQEEMILLYSAPMKIDQSFDCMECHQ